MTATIRVGVVLAVGVLLALPAAADNPPSTVRTVFQIEGMHCGACSSAITGELEKIDGVTSASADHEHGVAEAVYSSKKVEPEELEAAIEKLGYTVTSMKTESITG